MELDWLDWLGASVHGGGEGSKCWWTPCVHRKNDWQKRWRFILPLFMMYHVYISYNMYWYLIFMENHRFGPTAISQTPSRCFPLFHLRASSAARCLCPGRTFHVGKTSWGQNQWLGLREDLQETMDLTWSSYHFGGHPAILPTKKPEKRGSSSDSMWNLYISLSCH